MGATCAVAPDDQVFTQGSGRRRSIGGRYFCGKRDWVPVIPEAKLQAMRHILAPFF